MPWVVHTDHRAEEFSELRILVTDGDALTGAEHLGMTAGVEHVVVSGERPVPSALGKTFLHNLPVKGDRRLVPQRGERAVADVIVQTPEFHGAEVDIGQWHIRGSRSVHPSRDTHVLLRPSSSKE